MIRFYSPHIATTRQLTPEDSAHCVRVLRHVAGDEIEVVDGEGNLYACVIADANPKATSVEIESVEKLPVHWPATVAVAVAPTKNIDRIEWLVEKMTEIGVDEIITLRCDHSERKEVKTERLLKIIVSAMKQSLKATLPRLQPMTPFGDMIERYKHFPARFIAHCDNDSEKKLLRQVLPPATDTIIIIGPEGDFSPAEISRAKAAGFVAVSLGKSRLRTETAALSALATFHFINETSIE